MPEPRPILGCRSNGSAERTGDNLSAIPDANDTITPTRSDGRKCIPGLAKNVSSFERILDPASNSSGSRAWKSVCFPASLASSIIARATSVLVTDFSSFGNPVSDFSTSAGLTYPRPIPANKVANSARVTGTCCARATWHTVKIKANAIDFNVLIMTPTCRFLRHVPSRLRRNATDCRRS